MFTSCSCLLWVRKMISALSWSLAAGESASSNLLEQALIVLLPSLVDDHWGEVQVHLVSGTNELIDGCDAVGDR
jgi:hypothetical protein